MDETKENWKYGNNKEVVPVLSSDWDENENTFRETWVLIW